MHKPMQIEMNPPKTPAAETTLQSMTDLIDEALSGGSYGSIPSFLLNAARTNPHLDFNSTIQHVLTWRKMKVNNRTYSTCLIGIPLSGQLGRAFDPISTVPALIKEAFSESLLSKEDGLILLDSPVPRSTVQMMNVEDLYHLSSRLFERGVRGNPDPVLSARLMENEMDNVEEAIMVGLLYWRSDRPLPQILMDGKAQQRLAENVRRHLFFERASVFCPKPIIEAQPMGTLFEATQASSSQIIIRHLDRLIERGHSKPIRADLKIIMSDELFGIHHVDVLLHDEQGSGKHVLHLAFDAVRDGDFSDRVQFMIQQLAIRGIADIRTQYLSLKEVSVDPVSEALAADYSIATLH